MRAALHGRVAVIDEADKAPPHVTCILKALVEHGVLPLADGRVVVPAADPRCNPAPFLANAQAGGPGRHPRPQGLPRDCAGQPARLPLLGSRLFCRHGS